MARAYNTPRYAVRNADGSLGVRALPNPEAAANVARQVGGKVIVDPRSVQR